MDHPSLRLVGIVWEDIANTKTSPANPTNAKETQETQEEKWYTVHHGSKPEPVMTEADRKTAIAEYLQVANPVGLVDYYDDDGNYMWPSADDYPEDPCYNCPGCPDCHPDHDYDAGGEDYYVDDGDDGYGDDHGPCRRCSGRNGRNLCYKQACPACGEIYKGLSDVH